MKRPNRFLVAFAASLPFLCACSAEPDNGGLDKRTVAYELPIEDAVIAPVTVDELNVALSRDYPPDIEYALNEVKKSRLSFEVTALIACAYIECSSRNQNWHPVIYTSELVRVNLLDILVQAKSQGIDHAIGVDFRGDTIGFLASQNPFVVRRALLVLAFIGNDADVPAIEAEALAARDDTTFRVAILALKLMSSDQANDAIGRVLGSVDEDKRSIVEDLIE